MYMGNIVLIILNIPMVGLFVNLLRVPYRILYPLIIAFCFLGVYAVNGSVFEVWIMTIMGFVGYALRKFDFEASPIVIGLVLAPMLENALRQSLIMSRGSYAIFFQRPISASLLAASGVLLILALWPWIRRIVGQRGQLEAKKNETTE
jgi:putative tricarboxylic transport membrane protein